MKRKYHILKAIVELFVSTASPVGSKFLKESARINLSPATLRNEMAQLEREGFLTQSHISSGRVPTTEGYRFFVNELDISGNIGKQFQQEFQNTAFQYFEEKQADQNLYDVVSILSRLTPNITFATIPSVQKMFFLGISHLIAQEEFHKQNNMSGVFRVLEEDLYDFLHALEVKNSVEVFIGHENLLNGIDSCSLLVSKGKSLGETVFFGILGPMRMDYAKNIIALQESNKLFSRMN